MLWIIKILNFCIGIKIVLWLSPVEQRHKRNHFYLWNRRWKNDLGGDAGRGGASSSKAVCLAGILSGTSRGLLAGGAGVPIADSEFLGEEGCACCFELLLLACLGLLG